MNTRDWAELTKGQQRAILVAGALELVLTVYSLVDLRERSNEQLRGSKRWWVPLVFVQPVGPIAYLLFGRKGE
jgi:hypothetical protein